MRFLRIWTITVLATAAAIFSEIFLGLVTYVLENDTTYISVGILAMAALTSLWINARAYLVDYRGKTYKPEENNMMWFLSDAVTSIGMVGTLVGFLFVLSSSFNDIDTSSAESMRAVIGDLASGMGIAMLTTLSGLITSLILKSQLVILESK